MYEQDKGRHDMQKVWKGKLIDIQDHRKNRSKPIDAKYNQTKFTKEQIMLGESKMVEFVGKR